MSAGIGRSFWVARITRRLIWGELVAASSDVKFGEMLRELRVGAQLTQEELAARAKIAARTISDLERGAAKIPRGDTILRLVQGLELAGVARARFGAGARGGPLPAR